MGKQQTHGHQPQQNLGQLEQKQPRQKQPKPNPALDAQKLRDNAITSIRLGIEDFELCQLPEGQGGDPARALSAVRNLVAGVLLLFKFKIAECVDDPEDAAKLLFLPPEVLPHSDGEGGIDWLPVGRFRDSTIDVDMIKQRFTAFGITVDWDVFDELRKCRNHLEHLHPANTLGEVADLVAGLFPVLRDFITLNMQEPPAEVLGGAWQIMLKQHQFLADTRGQCDTAWLQAKIPEGMQPWLSECRCAECGSSLLTASPDSIQAGLSVERDEEAFEYACLGCGHRELVAPVLIEALNDAHAYDPSSGEDPEVEGCDVCEHLTFVICEQICFWCQAGLKYTACSICGDGLGQDDQHNRGLCGYHANQLAKTMRE